MRDEANTIIVALLASDDLKRCIKKVKPCLQEDVMSELSLILLETEPEKIIRIYKNKELNFYAARILLRLAFSKTSPFYKKFRIVFKEITDMPDPDFSIIHRKETEERALSEIEKLDWYHSEMVKLYLEVGTFRKMNTATHIPVKSCCHTVNSAIKNIQNKVLA